MKSKFKRTPATVRSRAQRKGVYGKGINDAAYRTQYRDSNGKQVCCPMYMRWIAMMRRCYCPEFLTDYPFYRDCSVCDEWLKFSEFRHWMKKQDWEGKQLELTDPKCKMYSELTCKFIPRMVGRKANKVFHV